MDLQSAVTCPDRHCQSDRVWHWPLRMGTSLHNSERYYHTRARAFPLYQFTRLFLSAYPAGSGTTATGDATLAIDIPDNGVYRLFNIISGQLHAGESTRRPWVRPPRQYAIQRGHRLSGSTYSILRIACAKGRGANCHQSSLWCSRHRFSAGHG